MEVHEHIQNPRERATEERKVYTAKILFPVFLFGGVH
jgi:hypothetical protein